jgi:Protein of unknown function (DUF2490)
MKRNLFYTLFFCAFSWLSPAQSTKDYTDIQTWYGASLKLDLAKKWAISAQYRLRMTEDASYYKGSYLFGQIDKRLSPTFALTTNYRLAMVDKGTYHRYAFGIEARKELRRFAISLRPMVQYQKQIFAGDDEQFDTDTYFRTRLTGKYTLTRRLDGYIYLEPFLKLDNNPNIIWWQNSAGIKYEVTKVFKVNLYYLWQPDFTHKKHTYNNHIIGLDLEFTIKPWR